jgi:RHS repeat-associated protein
VPGTHRLCAIGAAANPPCSSGQYQYDGNGNATLWSGRSLAYTPFNSPAQIADAVSGATLTYQHDAGHARIKEVSTVNGLTYYLGAYEEHTRQADSVLEQRHYVHTPEGIAGVVTLRSAPTGLPALPPEQAKSLRYWHKDHLGSVVAITGEAGTLKQTFTYDPWGQRTNPGLATGEPYAEERGYTGHEHLAEVRLIHMNGRVFDPAAGRFLQADPVVQEATNSQNYNRYAYVLNNPLSLTDPSGRNWLSKFIHKNTAQMQFLHGDLAGGWLTRKYADRAAANPYVRMVGAAVAAYYTYGLASGWAEGAGYSVAAANAIGGSAAGFASGGIQGGNVESAVWGAVTGAFAGYLSGGTNFRNPIDSLGQLGNAVIQADYMYVGRTALNYLMNRAASRIALEAAVNVGIQPEALDAALMSLSALGNEVTGSRFQTDDFNFSQTSQVGFRGYGNRGTAGYVFDTIDAILAFQGKPTASLRDFAYSPYRGSAVSGHSLGSLDGIFAVSHGLSPHAELYSVPIGNVATGAANVHIGDFDPINGGYLGTLFNWRAAVCPTGFNHALSKYHDACR